MMFSFSPALDNLTTLGPERHQQDPRPTFGELAWLSFPALSCYCMKRPWISCSRARLSLRVHSRFLGAVAANRSGFCRGTTQNPPLFSPMHAYLLASLYLCCIVFVRVCELAIPHDLDPVHIHSFRLGPMSCVFSRKLCALVLVHCLNRICYWPLPVVVR